MTSVDITFLSSRKRGISPDLRLVKRYLHENVDQINFRYFVNSELSPNYMVKRGIKQQKESFLQSSSHIICVDASLPGVRALEGREGKRQKKKEYYWLFRLTINLKIFVYGKKRAKKLC